jgi:hypothetical protein
MSDTVPELIETLRDAFLTDATFRGMLGAADNILMDFPPGPAKYPLVLIKQPSLNPQTEYGANGKVRPELELFLYVQLPVQAWNIYSRLSDVFTAPKIRPQGFTGTRYTIRQLLFQNLIDAGQVRDTQDGILLRSYVIPLSCEAVSNVG